VGVGLLFAVLGGVVGPPMMIGWRCYELHADGTRAEAEVIRKLEEAEVIRKLEGGTLVLQIAEAGTACTASTSRDHFDALETGKRLRVVYRDDAPGECTLESTLENSLDLLWGMTGLLAAILLGILGLGLAIHRRWAGASPEHASA
jgi:hypothetical protein